MDKDTLKEIKLQIAQEMIKIAPFAGNALFNCAQAEMRFWEGQYTALKRMRRFVADKLAALLLKETEEKLTFAEHVRKRMATLKDYDHNLFVEVVEGLKRVGWIEEGGSPTFRLLHKDDATIKIFRNEEAPKVIKVCFSAEPEEEIVLEDKADKIEFTEDAVKKYLDDCISCWRENGTEESKYYIDSLQSVRVSLFGELKLPASKEEDEKEIWRLMMGPGNSIDD